MKKVKVLIVVEGGIVQSIHANTEIEYVVVDFDDKSDEPVLVGQINEPDTVMGENDKFHEVLYKKDSVSKEDISVHEQLKEMNF